MKILKNIVIALIVIIVIAAVGIYFLPREYKVTNTIEINKPVSVVYAQLSDFRTWDSWSSWKEIDPGSKITVEGAPGTQGEKMSWQGEKIGEGNLIISWCEPNKSLHNELYFVKPYSAYAKDIWQFEADGDKTKVTWTASGGLGYPKGRLMGLSFNKMVDEQHEKRLSNLKKYCESLPAPQPMVASSDSTAAAEKSM